MDKRKLVLLLGALFVAIGTALAARSMLGGAAAPIAQAIQALPQGPKVLVAQRALPTGTIITQDSLIFQAWPKEMVKDAYFLEGKADMNKLLGTVVRFPVPAGQPVTQGALVSPGDRGFLAAALGPGMRAVTITVSARTGVAGFVFPGDHVDLMLTQTVVPIAQPDPSGTAPRDTAPLNVAETIIRNLRGDVSRFQLRAWANKPKPASNMARMPLAPSGPAAPSGPSVRVTRGQTTTVEQPRN